MDKEPISNKQRAAIYARVSSSKQSEEGTIESQISILADYANEHGFEIPDGWVFQDNGVSGSTIQRSGLDSLRDLVASGSTDVVLIYHPDRLARRYIYQAIILDEFSRCGVEVIFYKNKRAETPEEHLLEQFQGVFAEYERAQITERCRRGRLHKARQGSITTLPNAPYGYRYVRDEKSGLAHYEIHQEESEAVLKLFQMYAIEGKKISDLCLYMNQSGKKPRRSQFGWNRETVRGILRNRVYTGLAGFCKTEKYEGNPQRIIRTSKSGRIQVPKKARKACLEESWITIPVPAIIPDNLYRMVQDKIKDSQRFASRNTKIPSLLQGVLVCGKCGGSYYKKSRQNARTYYCCHRTLLKNTKTCDNRSIRQADLDNYVWEWIISLLRKPELVEAEIKRRFTEDPDKMHMTGRIADLRREQNRLITSRDKLLDAYTEGECLSLEELKKRMFTLNQRSLQVERELKVMETQIGDKEKTRENLLALEKFAKSLDYSSANLGIEDKQRVVRALIHEIMIYEDSVNVRHCIPKGKDSNIESENCLLHQKRS